MARVSKQSFPHYNDPIPSCLRKLRKETGVPQHIVAEAIGITRQCLSNYENGQSSPDLDRLDSLANYYGVSADYIRGASEVKTADVTVQAMAEYTGLSDDAIMLLHEHSKMEKPYQLAPFLSDLITRQTDYYDLFITRLSYLFHEYINATEEHNKCISEQQAILSGKSELEVDAYYYDKESSIREEIESINKQLINIKTKHNTAFYLIEGAEYPLILKNEIINTFSHYIAMLSHDIIEGNQANEDDV